MVLFKLQVLNCREESCYEVLSEYLYKRLPLNISHHSFCASKSWIKKGFFRTGTAENKKVPCKPWCT